MFSEGLVGFFFVDFGTKAIINLCMFLKLVHLLYINFFTTNCPTMRIFIKELLLKRPALLIKKQDPVQ